MSLIPTKTQWKNWSLPSKLTAVGTLLGIVALLTSIILALVSLVPKDKIENENNEIFDPSMNYEIEIDSSRVSLSIRDTSKLVEDIPNAMKTYDIEYPKITYKNNTYVEGNINELIKNEFLSWTIDIENIELSTFPGTFICKYNIDYKIHNLLGIRFNIYWYGTGAAHGNDEIQTYNINLINGKLFGYLDIFDKTKKETIFQLIVQKLRNHNCGCMWEKLEFELNNDRGFYFTHDEVVIVFRKYEVACGVCGAIEIKLLYNELNELINLNGPLKFL